MTDLRIVDAPEIPTENITGEEKLPTGGNGNYSISLDSLADYTKTKKDLADNTSVDSKVNGVRQELDTHIEDLLNPHQVTKGQIGLGNVDNTADADKPVSNSTQAAIISAVTPKADKTYADTQLTLKANKVDVYTKSETYTKQESSDLVNISISTALTPVNTSLDLAKRGIANRYDSSLTYNLNERVVLANGDIVKSTIDGNANDPNVNMVGWELPQARDIFDESGKNLQEVNDTNAKYLRFVTPSLYGIIDSSSIDQSLELQSMIYFAVNNGLMIIGERITCAAKTQIIIPPTLNANWNGFKIKMHHDFTGGTGSLVVMQKGASTASWQKGTPLNSLVIEGSSGNNPDQNLTLDGLYIGGSDMQTSDLAIYNLKITGFRDCLNFKGQSTYLLTFFNAQIGVANRRGVVYSATTDSGENIKFFGGSVFNCVNPTSTGTGVYNTPESSTLDLTLDGLSLDYCNVSVEMNQSKFTFNNCHFENNNNNPHIKMNSTSGKSRTTLVIKGGNLGGGPHGSAPFEDADGRPCYIELVGGSMNVDIDAVECGGFRIDGQKTEIVKNTGGQPQRRISIKPILDASRETSSSVPCSISNSLNFLYVAPNGSTDGWTMQGSWSADTTVKASYDTGSRLLITTGEAGSLSQELPCSAGQTLIAKCEIKTEGLTQGYATYRIQFLNQLGVVISDDVSPRRADSSSTSLTKVSTFRQVPSGAVKVRIFSYVTGMQATTTKKVWFTGERVWLY